jgi:RNA polymerase sigma factor (sigma-70 family)
MYEEGMAHEKYSYESNSLSDYWSKRADKSPRLSKEEELSLARLVRSGNRKARKDFIEANLRLVISRVDKIDRSGLSFSDLVQEGNIGLIKAVDSFDPDLGNKFSTFAAPCIDREVIQAIWNSGKTIRIPAWVQEPYSKIKWAVNGYYLENGCEPELSTLHSLLVKNEVKANRELISFESLVTILEGMGVKAILDSEFEDNCENQDSLLSLIPDKNFISPEDYLVQLELKEVIFRAIGQISSKKKQVVITKRFGLDNESPLMQTEIGRILNLTKQRVKQIENEVLKSLSYDSSICRYFNLAELEC